jgi:transposase
MTHSIADNNSIEIIEADDPHWDLPSATPEQRITRGFDMADYLGILAEPDEEDDHPGTADALAASGRTMNPYRDLPRAKPGALTIRGMDPEKLFGICADELDDRFLEDVMAIRRAERARGGRNE